LQHRSSKEVKEGEFSLNAALFDMLVQNKVEFVHLFMERVDLKKVLDMERLDDLYKKVFKNFCVIKYVRE